MSSYRSNFFVSNVGNNALLQLRPLPPPPSPPPISPTPSSPLLSRPPSSALAIESIYSSPSSKPSSTVKVLVRPPRSSSNLPPLPPPSPSSFRANNAFHPPLPLLRYTSSTSDVHQLYNSKEESICHSSDIFFYLDRPAHQNESSGAPSNSPSTSCHLAAATPDHLIAHITSPCSVDYPLLSDFFLTFRLFLTPSHLLHLLFHRLQSSLSSNLPLHRSIALRSYVALRHWILNYFPDDFLPQPGLRQQFCLHLNSLYHQLLSLSPPPPFLKSHRNLLNDLKKCWFRICIQHFPDYSPHPLPPPADVIPFISKDSFVRTSHPTPSNPNFVQFWSSPSPHSSFSPRPLISPSLRTSRFASGHSDVIFSPNASSYYLPFCSTVQPPPTTALPNSYPGDLINGLLYRPVSPFFQAPTLPKPIISSPPAQPHPQVLILDPTDPYSLELPYYRASLMKKLFGGVYHVLSRHPVHSPSKVPCLFTPKCFGSSPSPTPSLSHHTSRKPYQAPLCLRIDELGARAHYSFYTALALPSKPPPPVPAIPTNTSSPRDTNVRIFATDNKVLAQPCPKPVGTLHPKPPQRRLKRQPSGHLRDASTLKDLKTNSNLRPRSASSTPYRSDSSSDFQSPVSTHPSSTDVSRSASRKSLSLFETRSSHQNLRESFNAMVAELAAIPDGNNSDDDGGIDAALRKLEGRHNSQLTIPPPPPPKSLPPSLYPNNPRQVTPLDTQIDGNSPEPLPPQEVQGASIYSMSKSSVCSLTSSPGLVLRSSSLSSSKSVSSPLERVPSRYDQNIDSQGLSRSLSSSSTITHSRSPSQSGFCSPSGTHSHSQSPVLSRANSLTPSNAVDSILLSAHTSPRKQSEIYLSHPLRFPPMSEISPTVLQDDASLFSPTQSEPTSLPAVPPKDDILCKPLPQPAQPDHLPFVLLYDAEMLAQQFTLIEKDILEGIDWRCLVELRWDASPASIYDWSEYLLSKPATGVDLAISRFNLSVKWIISEILLTLSLGERIRTIVQFIRIATHARRLRNYSTTYQIVLALASFDVARLRDTWDCVSMPEISVFHELEKLFAPARNFATLRAEMEPVILSGEEGCIPFLGIYTHDLISNAQKPSYIPNPSNPQQPLINFERHRTTASIVRNLLRLLNASSRYTFPVQGEIVSRCLWISALSDKECAHQSSTLQS